jgi:hypothetical protein
MKAKNNVHYFEVTDLITQFISAFDSIIIGRFNKDRTNEQSIRVQFKYGSKQRIIHSLVNKAEHLTLPIISVDLKSVARDNDRVLNKQNSHYIKGSNVSYEIPQPVPVNISINMSIMTRHAQDMHQIISNFVPYADPYIIISWKLPPELSAIGTELRTEVLWDGSINYDDQPDKGEADKNRIMADTSFIIKGWLFKRHPDTAIGNIYEIDADFIPIASFSDMALDKSLLDVDSLSISAYPLITATKNDTFVNGTSPTIKLEGDNFDYTTAVYLSSDSLGAISDPISSYTGFDGALLTSYTITNDNVIYIDVPQLQDIGKLVFIVENQSGFDVSDVVNIINI